MKHFYIIAVIVILAYGCRWIWSSPTQEKNQDLKNTCSMAELANSIDNPVEDAVSEVCDNNATNPAPARQTAKPPQQEVYSSAISPAIQLENEVIICVAYVEHFRPRAYQCQGQWLIGYGQAYINGQKVRPGMVIDELTAQQEVRRHLRKYVFPMINSSVTRPLTRGEFIATCSVAYSTGTGAFKKSNFLKAINAGVSPEECISKLKGSGGVKKRRWVEAAIFMGKINAYDLLNCTGGGCYNFSNSSLYPHGVIDLSQEKIDWFLTSDLNQRGKTLMEII